MASEIRVNTFKNRSGLGTVSINDSGASFSGVVTATSFSGDLTGNVTSSSTSTFSNGLNVTGGNVGIGTDNPQAVLHAYHPTSNTIINVESGDAGAVLNLIDPSQRSSIEQNGTTLKISSDTGAEFASSDIRLQVDGGTIIRAESTGNVKIDNGNLVFSTSGTGIDFSATSDGSGTTTSELLDEYEEGTWTPVFKGAGTAGSYTLSVTEAQYTRIGRMVHLYCQFSISSIGSAGSAYAVIEGMPFDVGSQTLGSCSLSGVDIATAGTHYHVTRVSGVTDHRLYFFVSQDNASPYDIQVSEFSSGDSVMVTMMYTAA
jgi:hypothetical protein